MTRRPVIWAYLGNRGAPIEDLAQDAISNPELDFMFADDEDRSRLRRRVENALRKTASDRELLEMAVKLGAIES